MLVDSNSSATRFVLSRFRGAGNEILLRRQPVSPVVTPKEFKQKSYAQVESSVSPPNSGELKLDENHKASANSQHRRRNPLTVRLSNIERAIIEIKARTVGISVNAYVRAAALGSDYRPPANPELARALLLLNRELTSQGNNLNQIARQLNGNLVTSIDAESMLDVIGRSMLKTHKAVRQALSHGEYEP